MPVHSLTHTMNGRHPAPPVSPYKIACHSLSFSSRSASDIGGKSSLVVSPGQWSGLGWNKRPMKTSVGAGPKCEEAAVSGHAVVDNGLSDRSVRGYWSEYNCHNLSPGVILTELADTRQPHAPQFNLFQLVSFKIAFTAYGFFNFSGKFQL